MKVTGHIGVAASTFLLADTIINNFIPNSLLQLSSNLLGGQSILSTYAIWVICLMITIFASLLPDCDHPQSTIGSKIPFISYPMSAIFGHRGITHSLIALIGISFIGYHYLSSSNILTAFIPFMCLGYASHLFADSLTPSGVPVFYPAKYKLRFPIVQNGVIELFVVVILLSASVFIYFHPDLVPFRIKASDLHESRINVSNMLSK